MALTIRNFVIETLKSFYERLGTRFQETLVSGVNLKTVSGETLLGSGDVVIDWEDLSGVPSVFPAATHDHDDRYLKLSGGTMTGVIERQYNAASNEPVLKIGSANKDIQIFKVYSNDIANYTDTVSGYGYSLQYIGSGSGVTNYLRFVADNATGTKKTALSLNQSGQVGILADPSTSYALYVNGNTNINGDITASSFKKSGGTSSQFLKADGSVDSSSYALSTHNHDSSYVTITTDQTITGVKTFKGSTPQTDGDTVRMAVKLNLNTFNDSAHNVAAIGFANEATSTQWFKGFIGYERTGSYDRGKFVIGLNNTAAQGSATYDDIVVSIDATGNITAATFTGTLAGNASSATNATYAANVGSSGTAGTNYVTAAKVIATCNWYDTMTGSDTDTVINRWSEIVAFVANFEETPDLATFLSNNYLALSGGTMTGPIKWTDNTALPEQQSPQYFVCIDAFNSGGTTKWASKANTLKALTGLTSTAIGDSDEPVYWDGGKFVKAGAYPTKASWNYDDRYLKLSGGAVSGAVSIRKDLTGNLADWVAKQHMGPLEVGRSTNTMCVAIGVTDDDYGYIQTKGAGITTPGNLVLLPGGGNLYKGNTSNVIWHAGNDGSGSGLDADLLDGKHASEFSLTSHSHSYSFDDLTSHPTTLSGYGITDAVKRINSAAGAAFTVNSVLNWQGIEITTPFRWDVNNPDMFAFTIRIYNGYAYTDIVISGYCYGTQHWYIPAAQIIGGTKKYVVKFGYHSTARSATDTNKYLYVWIGLGKNTNNEIIKLGYGGFSIFNVHSGHSTNLNLYENWTAEDKSEDALSNVQTTQTPNLPNEWGNISGKPSTFPASAHNHDDAYLKLTGGTLTSSSNPTLNIKSTASGTSEVGIRFYRNTTEKAWIGYHDTYGVYLYNKARGKYLNYKDDGTLQFEGNTVWHAGNDGADSGLNADLLDGKHASDFATSGHDHDTLYVKLNAGAVEQTIKNSIGNISNGSIEIWRATSGGYPMIGFSTGTTKTKLGFLGFGATANEPLFRNTSGTDYKLLHSGNYTTYTVKKDGTGATGTWGISVTGSAGSVAWENVSDRPDWITWTDQSSTASYSLSNGGWTQTINLPTTKGSYILQLSTGSGNTESYLTGMFSISGGDTAKDEISLHMHGKGKRLYARTNGTKLELSSNDATAASVSVTIKYRRMI